MASHVGIRVETKICLKLATQTTTSTLNQARVVNHLHSSCFSYSTSGWRRRKANTFSSSGVPVTQIFVLHMRLQWKTENTLFHPPRNNNNNEVSRSVRFKIFFLLLVERWISSSADGRKNSCRKKELKDLSVGKDSLFWEKQH